MHVLAKSEAWTSFLLLAARKVYARHFVGYDVLYRHSFISGKEGEVILHAAYMHE